MTGVQHNLKCDDRLSMATRCSKRPKAGVNLRYRDFLTSTTQKKQRNIQRNKVNSTGQISEVCDVSVSPGSVPTDDPGQNSLTMTCDSNENSAVQHETDDPGGSSVQMICESVVDDQCAVLPKDDSATISRDFVEVITVQSTTVQTADQGRETITTIYPYLHCCVELCNDEVFIACPQCLSPVCYDHKDTQCNEHVQTGRQFITIVDEHGNVFPVEVESIAVPQQDGHEDGTNTVGRDSVPRKRRPRIWKRNIAKACRNSGQQYIGHRGDVKPMKHVQPNPCRKCQHQCSQWTEEERQQQFDSYWKLDHQQKRDWIVSHAEVKFPSRTKGDTRRQFTINYFMELGENGTKVPVCSQFFLATLNIGRRLVHYTLQNKLMGGTAKPDRRGTHRPANKTTNEMEEEVIIFISTLPAVPSHYCRSQSTRKYLPVDFRNLSFVYRLYSKNRNEKKEKSVSEAVFRKIFQTKFNIGFHLPKKDKCVTCEKFKNTSEDSRTEALQQTQTQHEMEKNAMYKEHSYDQNVPRTDKTVLCCSFDLQAVLATPRSESVLLFYSRKYATYNFTVYESVSRRGQCFVWGEAEGRRGSNEIATCLHRYILSVDRRKASQVTHIVMYCDSCGGQNRNRTVLAMLKYTLSLTKNVTQITVKFLLPGHTYMPADSMHATIERFTKRRAVWAPSVWPTIMGLARTDPGPYEVNTMRHTDFLDFMGAAGRLIPNQLKDTQQNNIKWQSVRVIDIKKGRDEATMRFSFVDGAESSVPLQTPRMRSRNRKGSAVQLKAAYDGRLPVSTAKFNDLKRLCDDGIIPAEYRNEYLSLPTDATTADCLPETDEEDSDADN